MQVRSHIYYRKRLKFRVGFASIVLCSLAFAVNAANTDSSVRLLSSASESFEAGDLTHAEADINEAFKGSLDGEMAAKAFLLRAEISEKGGKLSRALSDYSSALFTEKLHVPDQKKASEGKARVIAAMGLTQTATQASNGNASGKAAPRGMSQTPQATTQQATSAPVEQPRSLFDFTSSWFGGSGEEKTAQQAAISQPPPQQPQPAPMPAKAKVAVATSTRAPTPAPILPLQGQPVAVPAAESPPEKNGGLFEIVSGWFSHDEPKPPYPQVALANTTQAVAGDPQKAVPATADKKIAKKKVIAKPVQTAAVVASSSSIKRVANHPAMALATSEPPAAIGSFNIDFGSSNAQAAAQAQAQQIKGKLADILVNRELAIRQSGKGYRILAGPYKIKAAASALCKTMQQRGVNCKVV